MQTQAKKENPFINILANIILPVVILNKSHLFPTEHKALLALIVALSFPIAYGLWDLFSNSRKNYLSLLGVVNTLITGVFAVFKFEGDIFAIKEAAFPAILGIAVFYSSYIKKPFLKTLLYSSGLLNVPKIEESVQEKGTEKDLEKAFLRSNSLFSISFFISAFLNFVLAIYIFEPIDPSVSEEQHSLILNGQISQMTWMGMLVISLPMLVFLAATFYVLFRDLRKATGLSESELIVS